jgi:hypothetical protein
VSIILVTGSGATTTAVALAATWPDTHRPVVIEADPTGGSLSAWLGVQRSPGLSDLVSMGSPVDLSMATQVSDRNVDVVTAPIRRLEASATVRAALTGVLPAVAADDGVVALVDVGTDPDARDRLAPCATVVVATHRQHAASPAAAVIGLERLGEQVQQIPVDRTIVALIGDTPYPHTDVADYLGVPTFLLADDPFAAAALAGRPAGARRVASSPLLRSAGVLAGAVAASVGPVDRVEVVA